MPSVKSNHGNTQPQQQQQQQKQKQEPVKPKSPPVHDCYYPRRPCDLSFTVNMTTGEDDNSSRTDAKSTVIGSPASTVVGVTPTQATPPASLPPAPISITKPPMNSTHSQQVARYRPAPFNLARKLIAETSESALSEISIDHQHEPWTQNIAYQSRDLQRTRLSSSYSNLHDILQINDSLK